MYLRWNFVILGFNWYSLLEFLIKDNKNCVNFVCRIFDVPIEKLLLLIVNICFRNHLSNSNICNWRVIKIHAKSFEPTLVSEQILWEKGPFLFVYSLICILQVIYVYFKISLYQLNVQL